MTKPEAQGQYPHTAGTRWLGLLVGLVTFCFYVWRCSPSPYLLDSAELAAASFGLGVAHPPGEALALLWGRAFCLLPLGSVALRVGVGQAVCGSVAVVLLYVFAYRACDFLISPLRPSRGLRAVVCASGALAFGFSPGAAEVSSRPEVYALASALALLALWCAHTAWVKGDARWAVAAAFALGLGLANHPLIAGTAGLGAVAACVPLLLAARGARDRFGLMVAAVAGLLAGASVLLYGPARAYAVFGNLDPHTILWGDARTLSGWWWLLSARTFAEKASLVHGTADASSLPFLFVQELGIPMVCISLVGLYALARFTSAGRLTALVLFCCGAGAALSAVIGGLDPHNPDVRGYLGCAFAATAVFGSVGVCAFAARVQKVRARLPVGSVLTLALTATPLWALATDTSSRNGIRNVRSAEAAMTHALFTTPPRTVFATAHFETAFLLGYQRLVQAQRPDVTWMHTGWANSPGYAKRLLAIEPALKPLFMSLADERGFTTNAIDTLAEPLAVESSVALAPDLARALSYAGSLWHWPPQTPQLDPTGVTPSMFAEAEQHREVRAFLGWRIFQDARLGCRTHHPVVPDLIAKLQRLMPGDAVVEKLPAWCAAQGL